MGPIDNLNDLMIEQLRELFDGEAHALRKLKNLAAQAQDARLKEIVEAYVLAHDEQIMRLCQVFEKQYTQKRGEISESIEVMTEEALQLMERCTNPLVRDAAIVNALQHIMHYKIAGYGAASAYARTLRWWDEAEILHKCLEVEKEFDEKLGMIARNNLNQHAVHAEITVK